MAQSVQELLRDIFGEPLERFTKFEADQISRITTKVQELAREAVKSDLVKLQSEVSELRARIVELEAERARAGLDGTEPVI